jgi:hypothetical protein
VDEEEKPPEREPTAQEFADLITGGNHSAKTSGEILVEHDYSEFIFHFGVNGPSIVAHWPKDQGAETVDLIKTLFKTFTSHVKQVARMEHEDDHESGDPETNGVPMIL